MPHTDRLETLIEFVHATPTVTIKQARMLAAVAGIAFEELATALCASLRPTAS